MRLSVCHARAGYRLALGGLLALVAFSSSAAGQQLAVPTPRDGAPPHRRAEGDKTLLAADQPANQALLDKFQHLLTGAKLTGMFTVDGQPLDKLTSEQYDIEKVEKQTEDDWWLITARIKYGGKDFVLPVPVEVKWAGTTPVITLDKVTLPGYGTFSARVVFHGERYAGTWQHDDKGGHLFGKIELPK
jgi:hypothetical protein